MRSLTLLLLTACPLPDKPDVDPDTAAADTAADDTDVSPSITIVAPDSEAEVDLCAPHEIRVEVTAFVLADPDGNPAPRDGEGHYHLEFPQPDDTLAYSVCSQLTCLVDFSGAVPALATIRAQLVGNDHVPVTDAAGEPVNDEHALTFVACDTD